MRLCPSFFLDITPSTVYLNFEDNVGEAWIDPGVLKYGTSNNKVSQNLGRLCKGRGWK
jgi:hypothetical protein